MQERGVDIVDIVNIVSTTDIVDICGLTSSLSQCIMMGIITGGGVMTLTQMGSGVSGKYKKDTLVQVWVDKRYVATAVKVMLSNGMRPRSMGEACCEVIMAAIDNMCSSGGVEFVELASDAKAVIEEITDKPSTTGGRGMKNFMHNLQVDGERKSSVLMMERVNSEKNSPRVQMLNAAMGMKGELDALARSINERRAREEEGRSEEEQLAIDKQQEEEFKRGLSMVPSGVVVASSEEDV